MSRIWPRPRALESAIVTLVSTYSGKHRFTAADICEFHKIWLGGIYEWAGKYLQVNVVKDDFPFAAAARVPALMEESERSVLAHHTPCNFKDRAEVIRALAETHVELVLIHPFRDGNGRVARVLAILMGLQAGLPVMNFSRIAEGEEQKYFAAIRTGLDRNYEPMERLFARIIEQSLASS